MAITRKRALSIGFGAVGMVVLLQAFNSFSCYQHTIPMFLGTLLFLLIPMLPAILSLLTPNPLRAVGASMLFAPWLMFAYHTDCVRPYSGGGASMIYAAVVLWGLPSAAIGAFITGPLLRIFGVSVNEG